MMRESVQLQGAYFALHCPSQEFGLSFTKPPHQLPCAGFIPLAFEQGKTLDSLSNSLLNIALYLHCTPVKKAIYPEFISP